MMIYAALCASMIYQACGLDKKIPKANAFGIFWRRVDKKDAYYFFENIAFILSKKFFFVEMGFGNGSFNAQGKTML